MTAVPFHDYTIESMLIVASERRLVLRAVDAHATSKTLSVAEFSGVACYHFAGDVLGTILFDIEDCEPVALYERYAPNLQGCHAATGGHEAWVASAETARAFIGANAIRGFQLSVSIGATGAIWCRDFRAWTENGHAA